MFSMISAPITQCGMSLTRGATQRRRREHAEATEREFMSVAAELLKESVHPNAVRGDLSDGRRGAAGQGRPPLLNVCCTQRGGAASTQPDLVGSVSGNAVADDIRLTLARQNQSSPELQEANRARMNAR